MAELHGRMASLPKSLSDQQEIQIGSEKEQITEEETSRVLNGVPRHELPAMTEKLSLTDYFDSLPRNFRVLFKLLKKGSL